MTQRSTGSDSGPLCAVMLERDRDSRMKWTFVLLTCWWLRLLSGDSAASDELSDVRRHAGVPSLSLADARSDASDMNFHTGREVQDANWDLPEIHKDNYEDADWHPTSTLRETHPERPPVMRSSNAGERLNQSLSEQCGEYSGQLTSNGQCRLVATLPPVTGGASHKRCPDMFRCTDDISYWLLENQNRKEQLDELSETVSALQEELRSHRHRVKALELQSEENVTSPPTLDQRLHALELHQAKTDTLLHVHAALLSELQAQLGNLSASVQRMSLNTGCKINVIRTTSLLSMRDTLPPEGAHLSLCPSDCASLYHNGVRRSGVYSIVLSPGSSRPVYCDMETEGGGWTVLQRRLDGSVSFNRGWMEYREGFGEPRGEHWLGNQQLHLLSNQGHYSLRIELQDWSNTHRHAQYRTFRVDDEENHYRLHVSGFNGTAKDSFGWYHDQQIFSTPDTGNLCAEISHAGWWYHQCFYANLNGVYYEGGHYSLKAQNLLGPDGMVWFSWTESDFYSLKAVTMMIRPSNFRPGLSP